MRDKLDLRTLFENIEQYKEDLENGEKPSEDDVEFSHRQGDKAHWDEENSEKKYIVNLNIGDGKTKELNLEDAIDFIKKSKENGHKGEITINEAD